MVYRAMSMARAMRVRRAAMTEKTDDNAASVACEERENRKAINVTPVATGCTASPRMDLGPTVTLFEVETSCTEYPDPVSMQVR